MTSTDPNPWGWPTCLDCGRIYDPDDGYDRGGSCRCCYDGHEPYTVDEADGSEPWTCSHVLVTRCAACGVEMVESEPDEDGRVTYEVA